MRVRAAAAMLPRPLLLLLLLLALVPPAAASEAGVTLGVFGVLFAVLGLSACCCLAGVGAYFCCFLAPFSDIQSLPTKLNPEAEGEA